MINKIYYGVCFDITKELTTRQKSKIRKDINYLINKGIIYTIVDKANNKLKGYSNDLIIGEPKYLCRIGIIFNNDELLYTMENKRYREISKIIQEYNILPKLFIENIDIDKYKVKLAKIGLDKDEIYLQEKHKIDEIINKNFDVFRGLDSIYEKYTGAVYFNDNEWSLISDNSLKRLFEKKENNSYKYMLPLDDGNILRGADIYYFFASDVNKYSGPTRAQINKWNMNCKFFLSDCIKSLNNFEVENNYDIRLLLAVIDNIRNLVLLLINVRILTTYRDNSFIINTDEFEKDKYLKLLVSFIYKYQTLIQKICFHKTTKNLVRDISELCKQISGCIDIIVNQVYSLDNQYTINRCFNPLREVDNYFENYIVLKYVSKYIPKVNVSLIGILYGGLELPFILNCFINKRGNVSLVYQNKGKYLDRQRSSKDTSQFNMKNINNYNYFNTKNYLLDDNVMSGLTTQHIMNELIKLNCEVTGQITIRHPNINRLAQLKYFDCAVNLNVIDKFYLGALANTPYSKIKEDTNHDNMFVNELNIFSVTTELFLKALYINNSFIKNSEVDIFRGYSSGRPAVDISLYENS